MGTYPLVVALYISYPTEGVEAGNSLTHNHEFMAIFGCLVEVR